MDRFCRSSRSSRRDQRKWIGTAIGLALCSTALASCSGGTFVQPERRTPTPSQRRRVSNGIRSVEKQLREAIANAPANGLKPELFLKGGGTRRRGARPRPRSNMPRRWPAAIPTRPRSSRFTRSRGRRRTFARASRRRSRRATSTAGSTRCAPQTDEYKALSQAHLHFLELASKTHDFQPVPDGKPIKPGSHDTRVASFAAALTATGYLAAAQPQPKNASASAALRRPLLARRWSRR